MSEMVKAQGPVRIGLGVVVARCLASQSRNRRGVSRGRRDDVSRRHNIGMTCAEFVVACGKSASKRIRRYRDRGGEREGRGSIAARILLSLDPRRNEDAATAYAPALGASSPASVGEAGPICIPGGASKFRKFSALIGCLVGRCRSARDNGPDGFARTNYEIAADRGPIRGWPRV